MTYFITIEELKQTTFNANLDNEYIAPALEEAQSIYLREIIGDLLYNSITNKIDSETLSGKYLTLVNQYIKPYLTYKVQSVIVIPLNNKTRNAGIINQYDQGFNTSTMKDTAYLADYYNSRAEFYANRLTTYLQKNTSDFPEYGYSDDNITQPTDSQNVTTIYLGGGRKKGCGCNTSTPQATATTVEWDNITNRPDFAQVATSGDYEDLDNKPSIPTVNDAVLTIKQGGVNKGTFSANANQNVEINLEAGGSGSTDWSDIQNKPNFATVATSGDYNDLQNKPTIPTVPTNVSAFNNDAGYTTFDGDYNSLTNKPTIPAAPVQSDWNENDNTSLAYIQNKPTIPAPQVQADWQQNDSTQPDYIKNRPSMPSAQIQSDWNQTNTSEVDYIKNKPTIPVVPTNVSAFNNDAGYTTFDGDYNSLTNKPSIPAAQVNSDWNEADSSSKAYIQNKPSLATVATSGSYPDLHNRPSLKAVATSGDYNDLTNKPTIPAAQVQSDWNANSGMGEILNKPSLATVATTGNYSDLNGTPTIPAAPVQSDWNENDNTSLAYIQNKPSIPAAQIQSDWNQSDNQALDYIKNKPTIPVLPSYTTETWTFTLQDNTTVTKTVYLVPSV